MNETEDTNSNADEADQRYLDELRGYRQDLLAIQKDQITSYDKAILSLSGGALGVTIAFADKFGGEAPVVTLALLSAWAAFCAAICFNVLSYLSSSWDMEVEIEKVRQSIQSGGLEITSGNKWRFATQALNFLSLVAFIIGVGLFGFHAYNTKQPLQSVEASTNVERQTQTAK